MQCGNASMVFHLGNVFPNNVWVWSFISIGRMSACDLGVVVGMAAVEGASSSSQSTYVWGGVCFFYICTWFVKEGYGMKRLIILYLCNCSSINTLDLLGVINYVCYFRYCWYHYYLINDTMFCWKKNNQKQLISLVIEFWFFF